MPEPREDEQISSHEPSTSRSASASPARIFGRALVLTVVGGLVPGLGLIKAGRRKVGLTVLALFALLVGAAVYAVIAERRTLLHWAVQPKALRLAAIILPALAVAWAVVILATYRSLRPSTARAWQRLVGVGAVLALIGVVAAPLSVASRYAMVQKDMVEHIFAKKESKSATRPTKVTVEDPWAGQDRVNVLLLGGDGGHDRIGIRPDSIITASIDTRTGDTVLFSLPRNLRKIPFPKDSVLADAYPNGIYAGPGDQLEWMLNSIYENVPDQHPDLLDSDNPGADATKLAVSGALGLRIDYYVLVNLKAFEQLIDAFGGITVNVNYPVPKGGSEEEGLKPGGWIQPGPNQHLDGFDALWFARGRWGLDDYQRMLRQRCVIKAIIDQADPIKVLTRFEAIAKSSKDLVFTDIPQSMLPAFVDLSLKVKRAKVTSVAFTNKIISPWEPNYDEIHAMVQEGLRKSANASSSSSSITDSLEDACAYRPRRP
ncbi:LCP family protein [Thermasporomyces composti]|jgi:LCP family protein required for cell wall assembly|uniref:LCP family glycopolymer transferase n=1 Tax=Thermasporomyces composti TaxID=696763 RepID=UPI000E228021|nr:LCP family protein [Thermasporomyces composti]